MLSWRDKLQSRKQHFLKRRTFAQGKAETDAAHSVTQRLYCDVLRFWRRCGDPAKCLGWSSIFVPASRRLRARKEVIAGGPRRIPSARHIEWFVRRADFKSVMTWPMV